MRRLCIDRGDPPQGKTQSYRCAANQGHHAQVCPLPLVPKEEALNVKYVHKCVSYHCLPPSQGPVTPSLPSPHSSPPQRTRPCRAPAIRVWKLLPIEGVKPKKPWSPLCSVLWGLSWGNTSDFPPLALPSNSQPAQELTSRTWKLDSSTSCVAQDVWTSVISTSVQDGQLLATPGRTGRARAKPHSGSLSVH